MSILSLNFWFSYYPWPPRYLIIIAGIFIVAAIVSQILSGKRSVYTGLERRIVVFAAYNAVIALIFAFLNYEEVVLLSSHFWYALWILEIIIWVVFILRRLAPTKEARTRQAKDLNFKKYLP